MISTNRFCTSKNRWGNTGVTARTNSPAAQTHVRSDQVENSNPEHPNRRFHREVHRRRFDRRPKSDAQCADAKPRRIWREWILDRSCDFGGNWSPRLSGRRLHKCSQARTAELQEVLVDLHVQRRRRTQRCRGQYLRPGSKWARPRIPDQTGDCYLHSARRHEKPSLPP